MCVRVSFSGVEHLLASFFCWIFFPHEKKKKTNILKAHFLPSVERTQMAKPQHFSQSVSLVLQPAEEGVELELDVWVAVRQVKVRGESAYA